MYKVFLFFILIIQTFQFNTNNIEIDTLIEEKITGKEIKFYSINLNSELNENDLIIDSKIKTSAKFQKEETLKDGETKTFHLKEGDQKVFILDEFFQTEKDLIEINSFNLRMTNYKMNVEIRQPNSDKIVNVPVSLNWIGGQKAAIIPASKLEYKVIIMAEKDGIFNIEARTKEANSLIHDKLIKFDKVKQDKKQCYTYKINKFKQDNKLIINTKSLEGDIVFTAFPEDNNDNFFVFNLENKKELSFILNAEKRNNKGMTYGNWIVCAVGINENNSYYSLQVFIDSNKEKVEEHKKLLLKLLKQDKMYELNNNDNLLEQDNFDSFIEFRSLQSANNTDNSTNTTNNTENLITIPGNTTNSNSTNTTNMTGILIAGKGVAGIAVGFLYLIPISIAVMALMGIFVNTKYIDQPLKIKIME